MGGAVYSSTVNRRLLTVDLNIAMSGVVRRFRSLSASLVSKGGALPCATKQALGEPYQRQTLHGMLFILPITSWTKPLRFNI
jgi:hypothetical protein